VKPPGEARKQITPRYALVDTRSPQFLRATMAGGWHDEEQAPKAGAHWRWTTGDAMLRIENPQDHPLVVACTLDGWSFGERDLTLAPPGGAATPPQHLGAQRTKTRFAPVVVPPGISTLVLHSPQPAAVPPADGRALGVCVFGLELDVAAP